MDKEDKYNIENLTYYESKIEENNKIDKIDYSSDLKMNNKNDDKKKKISEKENNLEELELEEILINSNLDDNNELSQSLKNVLLDKEFASSVIPKKDNKLITDFHYVTFKNSYGENSCFINVILHLIYNIDELYEYLISLYQIDESNIEKRNINSNDDKNKYINKFFALLGKILYKYDIISFGENDEKKKGKNNKKNQITVLKTLDMRKLLAKISLNKFPLNTIADPVELFNFILDALNKNIEDSLHKGFYLELIDEFYCRSYNNCGITIKNKYDKDNFFYHIYIDEILNYINENNLKVKTYKNKLFELSYKLFLSENIRKCEKCKKEMEHNLVCMNNPRYLLINCVWKESNPMVDDVICLFFLMSLKDELDNLFICYNKTSRKKTTYYLFGFILYSFVLSHYVICTFNYRENVFVLYDDEVVKEYQNLYELIIDITVNNLKINGKAFFYPVMLIFTQDKLYESKIMNINLLNDNDYNKIISKCNEAIYEYQIQNEINEEDKYNNYQNYIEHQKEIEKIIKNKSSQKIKKNEKELKNNDINKKEINKYNKDLEIKNKENKANETNNKEYIRDRYNKKKYGQNNEKEKNINQNFKQEKDKNEINEDKLYNNLKDINKIKGEKEENALYFGNSREKQNDQKFKESEFNNEKKEIQHINYMNKKENKSIITQKEMNENENSEICKKRSNLEENKRYHNNNIINKKDEYNTNYQNNDKKHKYLTESINDKNYYINNNENNKNSKETITDIENEIKTGSKMSKSINVWNNKFNLLNKDNRTNENERLKNNDEKEEIINKKNTNEEENNYKKSKNNTNLESHTKKRFHYNQEISNNFIVPSLRSERKTNFKNTQFVENLNEKNNEDKGNKNYIKEKKEDKDFNSNNNYKSIRKKYYERKNKSD